MEAYAAAAAAKKLREKRKKVIKCGGCGALCDDADAFQAHCMEVEHDDDFSAADFLESADEDWLDDAGGAELLGHLQACTEDSATAPPPDPPTRLCDLFFKF